MHTWTSSACALTACWASTSRAVLAACSSGRDVSGTSSATRKQHPGDLV